MQLEVTDRAFCVRGMAASRIVLSAMAGTKERTPLYELGRRVAAARAYRDVTQKDLADAMGVDRTAIIRYEKGKIDKRYKREGLITAAEKLTKLPREFFVIDFNHMVEVWRRSVDPQARQDFELEAELREEALQKELGVESQQSQPSSHRTAKSKRESENQ